MRLNKLPEVTTASKDRIRILALCFRVHAQSLYFQKQHISWKIIKKLVKAMTSSEAITIAFKPNNNYTDI